MTSQRRSHVCAALACALFSLLPMTAAAQKSYNIWYFGDKAGIDFNVDPPVALGDGQMSELEGCASIAHRRTGTLLFYANGDSVWNRAHRPMKNGFGLHGHFSSTQTVLIGAMPGDTNRYYVFTAGVGAYYKRTGGIEYSIVDMRGDNGFGGITTKNKVLLDTATEKLTAVYDATRTGYWLLAHGWGDDRFYAWHVTPTGIAAPVISRVGMINGGVSENSIGYLKSTIDCRHLAAANYGTRCIELLDFDNATGIVSNPIAIPVPATCRPYSVCFSPDGRRLYASLLYEFRAGAHTDLIQYDVTAGDGAAIASTAYDFGADDPPVVEVAYWVTLMLGPDGVIYCTMPGRYPGLFYLSTISRPNEPRAACRFKRDGMHLAPRTAAKIGLPNVIDLVTQYHADTATCAGAGIMLAASPVLVGSLAGDEPLAYHWALADGLSCTDCATPIASPSATTKYELTVTGRSGNPLTQWTTVHVTPRHAVRAAVQGGLDGTPGDTLELRVELVDDALDLDSVRGFTVRMHYDTNSMRPDRSAYAAMLAGTRAEGWTATVLRDYSGVLEVHVVATDPTAYLHGAGTLLRARMWTYIHMLTSDTATWSGNSTVTAEVIPDASPCADVTVDAASVRLTMCGLNMRLIELVTGTNALDANRPNPFNPTTEIGYSVALDGPVRLEVLDALGREVACLVDEVRKAGRYSVRWDAASQPSGLYYYRLRSAGWSAVRTMMLVK